MNTITIMDRNSAGLLSVGLADILGALKPTLDQVEWRVSGVEAIGAGADALYGLEGSGARVTTAELEALAETIDQVVDGYFYASTVGESEPTIRLRAVDSSSWDVSSDRNDVLDAVRQHFRSVYEAGDVG